LTTANFFNDTKPEIVASFAGFKHHKTDRAGGFGHVVTNTMTTTIVTPGITSTITPVTPAGTPTSTPGGPILKVDPPIIVTVPITPVIKPAPSGGPSAVPLPPAAPAGLAMLTLIGLTALVKKLRGKIA
jgi:hypothetical protein